MSAKVTICIPVAPYHETVAQRAIDSALAQTVACDVLTFTDSEQRGAGFSRNVMLREVNSDFVIFLDADDEIAPTFIERCIAVWKPKHYVYTGWMIDGVKKDAPQNPWNIANLAAGEMGEWHVLTALLPTNEVKRVGGFDESFKAGEDTLLYWGLTRSGVCGIPVNEPLFTYGTAGTHRSHILYTKENGQLRATEYYQYVMGQLIERYGDMGCCGDENPIKPSGERLAGDIEAMAMWGGNRRELGVVTGRLYTRASYPHHLWVDPRDVDARPDMWQRVMAPPPAPVIPPQAAVLQPQGYQVERIANGVHELAAAVHGQKAAPQVMTAEDLKATLPANVKPDASKVRKLAGKGKK